MRNKKQNEVKKLFEGFRKSLHEGTYDYDPYDAEFDPENEENDMSFADALDKPQWKDDAVGQQEFPKQNDIGGKPIHAGGMNTPSSFDYEGKPEMRLPMDRAMGSPDMLRGGLADDMPDSDFDSDQLMAGIEVESEHTRDVRVATEIAKDHLEEDPLYYQKLKKMEMNEISKKRLKRKERRKERQGGKYG